MTNDTPSSSFAIMQARGRLRLNLFKVFAQFALVLAATRCLGIPIVPAPPVPRHPVWRISGHDNSVYLLGAVHFLRISDYPLPSAIESAYSNAPVIVFETDLARLQEPAVQERVAEASRLPHGTDLANKLSWSTYRQFQNCLSGMGLPGDIFDHLKPAIAAITLASLEMERLGFYPDYGIDQYFFERGQRDQKELLFLESPEFQVALLTSFSQEQNEIWVRTLLNEFSNTGKWLQTLLEAWHAGDASLLEKLLFRGLRQAPSVFDRLVTERNQRWLPHIEELLRGTQQALVIVGMDHLVGANGLLSLLSQRGWTVTQE